MNSASDSTFSTWCQLNPTKLSFSTAQLLGNLSFEPRRGCLQKHTIAEMMAPSILVGCSWTNISNKSWQVEDFFGVMVRGIRGTLGDLYLPSISTSTCTFSPICMGMESSMWGPTFGSGIRYDPKPLALGSKRKWNLRENLALVGYWSQFFRRFWWPCTICRLIPESFLSII